MAYAPTEVTGAVKAYLKRMLTESGVVRPVTGKCELQSLLRSQGMKALLVDSATMGIVSAVFSQTEILNREVWKKQTKDSARDELLSCGCHTAKTSPHTRSSCCAGLPRRARRRSHGRRDASLKGACPACVFPARFDLCLAFQAVCFLRPLPENISALRRHLRKPKFGEYHVCARPVCHVSYSRSYPRSDAVFTNVLKDSFLHELADADEGELVKQVQVCVCLTAQVLPTFSRSGYRNTTRTTGRWTTRLYLSSWNTTRAASCRRRRGSRRCVALTTDVYDRTLINSSDGTASL